MSDDEDDEGAPASTGIPIVTDGDGQAYIPVEAVTLFMRGIAQACRNLGTDPEFNVLAFGDMLDVEADNLDCMAIERTT